MDNIAVLFPGQGCQYIGMGKKIHDEFDIARKTFDEANEVLGFNLKDLCFDGSLLELNRIDNMLVSILTTSVAIFRVYMKEIGIKPRFAAGHSLGEYSALTCSGAMNFSDALKIVRKRGSLAQEFANKGIGGMTVINGIDKKIIEKECNSLMNNEQIVSVACYNSPTQVVISGHNEAVMKVEDRLMNTEAQITPLLMSAPFHCKLMSEVALELENEIKKYSFNEFLFPTISNIDGLLYSDPKEIIKKLTMQICKPVQWDATMNFLYGQGITTFIEMGPQAVLTNLINKKLKNVDIISFGQKDDRERLIKQVAINKNEIDKHKPTVITKCLAMAVCTKNCNWDEEEYKRGVIIPYEKIQALQGKLEKENLAPNMEQMNIALELLKQIFNCKRVPIEEQITRIKRIFHETRTEKLFEDYQMPVYWEI